MIFDSVEDRIKRGMAGLNRGLPMGFERLVQYVPNVQRGTYYLVGGETGSGKTAFTDDAFVFNPYEFWRSNPEVREKTNFKIFYWSLEIDKEVKITKAVCRKLFLDYGLTLDINYVLSRGKNRCSQEHFDMVMSCRSYFEEMEDVLEIMDLNQNPTGVNKFMLNYAKANGEFVFKTVNNGKENIQIFDKYIPKDPNEYVLIVIDHISLMKRERGYTVKDNIDKMSEYLIPLRNNFGYSPVIVQQLNRSNTATDRFKMDMVEPKLSDFKDSGNTQQDANVIMSLFSPRRHELENFRGYDIRKLKDRFRSLSVLKNRDGASDVRVGLQFVGEVGYFNEIPKVQEFKDDPSLYQKIVNLETINK
jgi:replicative DNA helicase